MFYFVYKRFFNFCHVFTFLPFYFYLNVFYIYGLQCTAATPPGVMIRIACWTDPIRGGVWIVAQSESDREFDGSSAGRKTTSRLISQQDDGRTSDSPA